jgi:hypothetical protein
MMAIHAKESKQKNAPLAKYAVSSPNSAAAARTSTMAASISGVMTSLFDSWSMDDDDDGPRAWKTNADDVVIARAMATK